MSRACRLIGLIGVAAFAIILACRRLDDFDLPWHLATGRFVVSHGVPTLDPFAYTHRPLGYTTILTDVALSEVVRAAGLVGLQALGGAVAVAVAVFMLLRARGSGAMGAMSVGLGLVALRPWLIVSAGTISLAALAAVLLLLDTHRAAPSSRAGRLALAAVVPTQLLWANAHGFAAIGAWTAALYLGHRVAARLARGRWPSLLPRADGEDLGRTAAAVGLALAATCANTAGARMLLGMRRAGEVLGDVTEWARPTLAFVLRDEPTYALLLLAVAASLAFGKEKTGARAPRLHDLGLIVGAVAASLLVIRGASIAAVVLPPMVARRLAWVLPRSRLMALAGALSLLVPPTEAAAADDERGAGFSRGHFPEAAVAWISREHPSGRMYDFMPFGGYLIWRLYPEYEVFMDGRNTLAREADLVRRSVRAEHDDTAFAELVRDFDMEWAITRANPSEAFGEPLARDRRWMLMYLDDTAAVYVRRDGANGALSAERYRWLRHLTSPAEALAAATSGPLGDDVAHDGALARAQAPTSVRAAFFDACGAIAARDEKRLATAVAALGALGGDPSLGAALGEAWGESRRR